MNSILRYWRNSSPEFRWWFVVISVYAIMIADAEYELVVMHNIQAFDLMVGIMVGFAVLLYILLKLPTPTINTKMREVWHVIVVPPLAGGLAGVFANFLVS